MSRLSRRRFLGAALGSVAASTAWPVRAQPARARVVSIRHGDAWTGSGWTDADLDATRVRVMVEHALTRLAGRDDLEEAVEHIFPRRHARRYGVKVNCVNPRLPSHPTVVRALASLLVDSGVPGDNIVVFDRTGQELELCGFSDLRDLVAVTGSNHDGVGYSDTPMELTHGSVRLSTILDAVDTLINIPVMKNHEMTGVTLALKNHFGSIDHPQLLHGRDRTCCPGIAEVNGLEAVSSKTRLVLTDALFATATSGLGGLPDFAPMTLLAATDPVAIDRVGLEIINARRTRDGHGPVSARHIGEAASADLGEDRLNAIEQVTEELSPVVERQPPESEVHGCAAAPVMPTAVAAWLAARLALTPPRAGG